ncbi:uncharacterized protein LOC105193856 isoform X2 [Solenopsis invicta]|uniref:uncharacterized protein LOC105193856 isoform X2 n=1 Tax=Solenopsis invicta TaxID=13686 RepID=UPI00193E564B|nr:uncharacterized protein LOC105193856 isoform X2 [Solenopsis invicta]
MAKASKKHIWVKNSDKLKVLYDQLRTCTVLLHDIALDKDLVQLHHLTFSKKKKEELEHMTCSNMSDNLSNNVWMSKENMWEDNTEDKTTRVTRSRLKRLAQKKSEECNNIKFSVDVPYNQFCKIVRPEFITQKQQVKYDISESSLNKNNDEIFSTSSYTYCSSVQKKTLSSNSKKPSNERPNAQKSKLGYKRKLQFDKSALSSNIIDTNIEHEKISETSEDIKADFKSNTADFSDNFFTTCNNINGSESQKNATICLSKKTMSLVTCNTVTTGVLESIASKSTPIVSKTNCITKIVPDLLTNNKKKSVNKTNNKQTTKKSLPKITEDHILPKGTIKIMKVNTSDKSSVEQSRLEQNGNSDTINDAKQVSYGDTILDSTNILTEKKYDTLKINRSINMLKISESTSAFNNNIDLTNKNIDNINLHRISQKVDHKNLDFLIEEKNNINVNAETTGMNKNYIFLNHQEQSNRLDNDEHESNIQGKNINENTSNVKDINENYNINGSLIFVSKKKVAKQNRKRGIAEENTVDIKLNNKKKRLNRTVWQNSVTCAKSLDHQQFNNSSSIDMTVSTTESNISEKNDVEQIKDLRERLNKKRSKQLPELSVYKDKFKNKNSVGPIDLNKKYEKIITPISTTKNEKRLSFEIKPTFSKTSHEEEDIHINSVCSNHTYSSSTLLSTSENTQHLSQIDRSNENTNVQKKHMNKKNKENDDYDDNDDDGDYISLFAESFDTNFYETIFLSDERVRLNKSPQSEIPYIMTTSSFNKYVKQNATEFNKEYAEYIENNEKTLNKTDETNRQVNNKSRQTINTDIPETLKVTSFETKNKEISKSPKSKQINIMNFFKGYCFSILKRGTCNKSLIHCKFNHIMQTLIKRVCLYDLGAILDIMQEALYLGYNFFCTTIYSDLIQNLTVDQILMIYQMFYEIRPVSLKDELTMTLKMQITDIVITELLKRQLSLKTIVTRIVEYISSIKDLNNLMNILVCFEKYIKRGEYWNTAKTLILRLPLNKRIIERILLECIENKKSIDIQDVNSNLIDKVSPILISQLDKDMLERFKNLSAEKVTKNSHPTLLIQNFGENSAETIASPDGNTNILQTEFPRYDIFTDKAKIKDFETEVNGEAYIMRPIDDLPEARSVYRDHKHLWKFYVDLDRFKKGLLHQDYDYVIEILKKYAEKQDENTLFIRSCCKILQTEVKRSEYHLANIVRRAVHMDIFGVLGKILFNIGLNILTSLVDTEAWGLALWLIQSLNVHDLPCNADYFLLSAEIYLANKKAIKAYDLLKYKNIICTSRDKWYVRSTINDEHVRNKIMYILLDSFCNEFVEYAFCLFQFLLKDQCSQYYPIDLSRYVDKLIVLFLSRKDTNLITEMANLVLKYTFALNTATCRALISTLIHMDENLARQIYNYAEGVGIYPAVKVWPITYIIINTDLTEEEIYLTFLQLLKNLIINVGHAIEFVKPHQIKVYIILEIKSINEQFYCAESQNYYNNKVITNIKTLVRNVLKKRFNPPILLMPVHYEMQINIYLLISMH